MKLNTIRFLIESIYSQKFIEDTKFMSTNPDDDPIPFSNFVSNYFINKYKKKDLIDKNIVSFLSSVEFYSKTINDVKIFSKFLSEEYNSDDLIYFLFIRSCVEKELSSNFVFKAQEALKKGKENADTDLYFLLNQIPKLAIRIFGKNDTQNINAFKSKINNMFNQLNANNKKKTISARNIIFSEVEDYHNNNEDNEEDEENPQLSHFNTND